MRRVLIKIQSIVGGSNVEAGKSLQADGNGGTKWDDTNAANIKPANIGDILTTEDDGNGNAQTAWNDGAALFIPRTGTPSPDNSDHRIDGYFEANETIVLRLVDADRASQFMFYCAMMNGYKGVRLIDYGNGQGVTDHSLYIASHNGGYVDIYGQGGVKINGGVDNVELTSHVKIFGTLFFGDATRYAAEIVDTLTADADHPNDHGLLTEAAMLKLLALTAQGDLVFGGVNGKPTRLGIGTNGYALFSNGTTPVWQAIPTQTGDHKSLASSTDTTPDYLSAKVTGGTGVDVSPNGAGDALVVYAKPWIEWPVGGITMSDDKMTLTNAETIQLRYNASREMVPAAILICVTEWNANCRIDVAISNTAGTVTDANLLYYGSTAFTSNPQGLFRIPLEAKNGTTKLTIGQTLYVFIGFKVVSGTTGFRCVTIPQNSAGSVVRLQSAQMSDTPNFVWANGTNIYTIPAFGIEA